MINDTTRRAAIRSGILLLAPALSAQPVPRDDSFRLRVQTVDSLFARASGARKNQVLSPAEYTAFLRLLREEEIAIAEEAKAHKFSDITESNYWFRSRLKFPTVVEIELRQISEGGTPLTPLR